MNSRNILFLFFLVGLLGRVLPHPASVTPFHALCLLAGLHLSSRAAILTLLGCYFCADICLAFLNGFPILGAWSIYTYTGLLGLIYLGMKNKTNKTKIPLVLTGSFSFWLWTNLGVWLHSGLYPRTLIGFTACYTAALPFLNSALLGDIIWFTSLSFLLFSEQKVASKNSFYLSSY